MLSNICLALILVLPCAAQLNYQERSLYLEETDNVCRFGDQCDRINLEINLDDAEILKTSVGGHTFCYEWGPSLVLSSEPCNLLLL